MISFPRFFFSTPHSNSGGKAPPTEMKELFLQLLCTRMQWKWILITAAASLGNTCRRSLKIHEHFTRSSLSQLSSHGMKPLQLFHKYKESKDELCRDVCVAEEGKKCRKKREKLWARVCVSASQNVLYRQKIEAAAAAGVSRSLQINLPS